MARSRSHGAYPAAQPRRPLAFAHDASGTNDTGVGGSSDGAMRQRVLRQSATGEADDLRGVGRV